MRIGLDREALEEIAEDDVAKCSARDLPVVMARRATGATTVAATATLAVRAGIGVFATGGLGGVHREARESWDESADLTTLGQTPITVVCAGVKSILDVEATLERLETLNVTLLGYQTDRFPGFYLADSGFPVPWRVDTPAGGRRRRARARRARARGDRRRQPDRRAARRRTCTTACWTRASRPPREQGVRGKDVTPFLLDHFHRETRRREPGGERPARAAQRRARRADRPRHGMTLVVLGDLMVDVVARVAGSARARERHARADQRAGRRLGRQRRRLGGGARHAGRRSCCRVGDDDRGRARGRRELRGVDVHAAVDPERPDRHLRRARRARRRADDAPRPRRQRRPAARDPSPATTCTSSATRCCATGRGRARWRRSSAPARRG